MKIVLADIVGKIKATSITLVVVYLKHKVEVLDCDATGCKTDYPKSKKYTLTKKLKKLKIKSFENY